MRVRYQASILLPVLCGWVLAAVFACAANPGTASAADDGRIPILPGSSQFNFIAYGDIRFTNPTDTRNTNPQARQALVQRIAELVAPASYPGEITSQGGISAP